MFFLMFFGHFGPYYSSFWVLFFPFFLRPLKHLQGIAIILMDGKVDRLFLAWAGVGVLF